MTGRDKFNINKAEAADYKWMDISELQKDLLKNPGNYTPWLSEALQLVMRYL